MDYRESARSPSDRPWTRRDDGRKDDRDLFYRGRSPVVERSHIRRPNRSRSPPNIDRYEPRPRGRDDYGGGRDRDDRRRVVSPPSNIDRYVPGQPLHQHQHQHQHQNQNQYQHPHPHQVSVPHGSVAVLPPPAHHTPQRSALTNPIPDPLKLPYQVGFSFFGEWWRANEKIKEEMEAQRTGRRPERRGAKDTPEEREKEKARIQAAYDRYKEEVQAKMAQAFVKQHKEEQWFIERYVPEVRGPIQQQLGQVRKAFYSQWEQDLDSGVFDEFTLEGVPRSDLAAVAGAAAEREEGEATANEMMGVGDLVPATNAADIRDETLSAPTLLIKTIAPTVSRKNLETFCRENLGEGDGGYRWLSLSDPNPSKRYHRIGWIMLKPGQEGGFPVLDEDGNVDTENPQMISIAARAQQAVDSKTVKDDVRGDFTIHVGVHNPPHQLRKKALWDLFSAPERIDRDLHLVQRLVAKFESEVDSGMNAMLRVEERVEELKASGRLQPARVSSGSVQKTKKKKTKTKTKTMTKKRSRALDMDVSLDFDTGMDNEDMDDQNDEDDEDSYEDGEGEEGEEGEELEDGGLEDEVDDEYLTVQKKQLDLLIEYLRRVFNFCFFCVFESDSVHELTRKCPGGHLRRPRSMLAPSAQEVARATAHGDPFPASSVKRLSAEASGTGEAEEGELAQDGSTAGGGIGGGSGGGGSVSGISGVSGVSGAVGKNRTPAMAKSELQLLRAYNWVKTFEEKIHQILEPGSADLRKFGGKPIEEALASDMGKYVKQEDEHKYRCKLPDCTKLFKEEHFWRKHVEKRHTEWYDALKAELELVNAYAADPSHIAPSRTDANSNGHFPAGTSQNPTGTPRGFNLSNYNMKAGLPVVPGFPMGAGSPMGAPGAGYNMYNPVAMQVPGSWQAPGGLGAAGLGAGLGASLGASLGAGSSPMRRGGGHKFNNNRASPYERRPMRWHPDAGLTGGPSHLLNSMGGRNAGGGGSGSGSAGSGGGRGGHVGGSRGGAISVGLGPRGDAVGPQEATQGRTLKSYEDLDQVGNGGGGELNY